MVEKEFGKVLTTRQAMGTAALQQVEDVSDKAKNHVAFELKKTLKAALPKNQEPDIQEIKRIVTHAVQLRNDMTKELAIYYSYWFRVNEDVLNSEVAEYQGVPQSRSLALCVFPALARRIRDSQGNLTDVCVIVLYS
jgi:hypothetical protein